MIEPKYKRCACGVRLFQMQGESGEAYTLRTACPRCALKAIHAYQDAHGVAGEAPEAVGGVEDAAGATEAK